MTNTSSTIVVKLPDHVRRAGAGGGHGGKTVPPGMAPRPDVRDRLVATRARTAKATADHHPPVFAGRRDPGMTFRLGMTRRAELGVGPPRARAPTEGARGRATSPTSPAGREEPDD